MLRHLAELLAVLDLALGLAVFALLARPEAFLGVVAALVGQGRAWDEGRLGEEERRQLLHVAERAAFPALTLLFGWSFMTGALLLAARF